MAISGVGSANGTTALPQAMLEVYSQEIMHRALDPMRFEQFAVIKDELTNQPGTTINFTIYENLALGGQLQENVDIVPKNLSANTVQIIVTEWGNAVAVTEKLLQTSYDDVLSEAAFLLARDYARVVDLMLRDTVMASINVIWAGGASSNGTTSAPISMDDVRRCTEIMYTNNVPKFQGDFFVMFLHPHQTTGLKRDPEWQSVNTYNNGGEPIFRGELGRFDDVRFVGTGHMNNGACSASHPAYDASLVGTGAGSINLFAAALFGDNYYGWAVGLPVEMRDDGVHDLGRRHVLGWYTIMGSGIINVENGLKLISA